MKNQRLEAIFKLAFGLIVITSSGCASSQRYIDRENTKDAEKSEEVSLPFAQWFKREIQPSITNTCTEAYLELVDHNRRYGPLPHLANLAATEITKSPNIQERLATIIKDAAHSVRDDYYKGDIRRLELEDRISALLHSDEVVERYVSALRSLIASNVFNALIIGWAFEANVVQQEFNRICSDVPALLRRTLLNRIGPENFPAEVSDRIRKSNSVVRQQNYPKSVYESCSNSTVSSMIQRIPRYTVSKAFQKALDHTGISILESPQLIPALVKALDKFLQQEKVKQLLMVSVKQFIEGPPMYDQTQPHQHLAADFRNTILKSNEVFASEVNAVVASLNKAGKIPRAELSKNSKRRIIDEVENWAHKAIIQCAELRTQQARNAARQRISDQVNR